LFFLIKEFILRCNNFKLTAVYSFKKTRSILHKKNDWKISRFAMKS
jgi:hypothetical protein